MPRYFSSVALFFAFNNSSMCCKLTKCCCGCSLQTGSKVIGVLSLVPSDKAFKSFQVKGLNHFLQLAGVTGFLLAVISISSLNLQNGNGLSNNLVDIITWFLGLKGNHDQLASSVGTILGALVVIAISISALVAAWKNFKPILLVPWLVLNALSLPILIASVIYYKDRWLTVKEGGTCSGTGFIAWGLIVGG